MNDNIYVRSLKLQQIKMVKPTETLQTAVRAGRKIDWRCLFKDTTLLSYYDFIQRSQGYRFCQSLKKNGSGWSFLLRYAGCQCDWFEMLQVGIIFFSVLKVQMMGRDPLPCPWPSKQIAFPGFCPPRLPLFNIRGFLIAVGKNYGVETWLCMMYISAD